MKKIIIEASCANCVYCSDMKYDTLRYACAKGGLFIPISLEDNELCEHWQPNRYDMRIKIQRAEELEKIKNIRPKCEACGLIIEKEEDEMICKNCGELVHKDCRGRTKRVCCSCSPVED